MTRPANHYSLVADIGGTNTRVALAERTRLLTDTVTRYANTDYAGLESVLRVFIEDQKVDCKAACVALAGPVKDGRGSMTNLDWELDEATLARATKAETARLLNDLQAQGHALGSLADGAVTRLVAAHDSDPDPNATKLVIGVGTGFNIAPVFETRWGRHVPPSESGHANLPLRSEAELRLAQSFETAHGFPAVEDMMSGRGLERVYAWLGREAGDPREARAAQIMAGFEDRSDPRAREAAEMFVRMLGTVAGNLSLIHLPFGGVFFSGGVARAFAKHFATLGFADAFRDKGRFAGFMGNFEVSVIEDDYAALTGCANYLAARI
ncbi:glucokinase [Litoreibacter arenae]|uniref:Glucokinase n=1 Tax=Litoreibacter arenae DSM 19593 TaxID=1123360 RepID=S9QC25_9RHOB|nr:glucokinase [Litoreibacter arenae]EPX78966.1 Glucokinase [Litoreibacter arenae DSM 19593]